MTLLSGVAPIPASSGLTTRHRLNRRGDRRLLTCNRSVLSKVGVSGKAGQFTVPPLLHWGAMCLLVKEAKLSYMG